MVSIGFLGIKFLGVRLWIWLYLVLGIAFVIFTIVYYYRENIKAKYYKIRYPERTIRIVIHYTGAIFKEFYRIIPTNKLINIQKVGYFYDPKSLQKHKEIFAEKLEKYFYVDIDDKKYQLADLSAIRQKDRRFPELHYYYNNPNPINFNQEIVIKASELKDSPSLSDLLPDNKKEIPVPKMTGKQLKDFEEQDMFNKLLNLKDQNTIMMILLMITVLNIVISVIIALKVFDIIKSGTGTP